MRTLTVPRRSLSLLHLSAFLFCLTFANSFGAPPVNVSQDMIISVLHRGDTYIASTRSGLYRASEPEKVWRKIPTPASMPPGGFLVHEGDTSSRLIYYTGTCMDFMFASLTGESGSLYFSQDAGNSWTVSSLKQNVNGAFMHPDGAIFAITQTLVTAPFPPGGNSVSTVGKNGLALFPRDHLLRSVDNGHSWKEITPTLRGAFGLYGIFLDPDHPDLVCVQSEMIDHMSRSFIYQANDETYHWKEVPMEIWPMETRNDDLFIYPESGTANSNSDRPADMENFFKYPYRRSGNYPRLPTSFLVAGKAAYSFHLHQPMLLDVSTFFTEPYQSLKITDNADARVFWGLIIQPGSGKTVFVSPRTAELNSSIPNRDAKIAAYSHDANLFTFQASQAHPYRREIDLRQLYDFSKPGQYRLAIYTNSTFLDRASGSRFGTLGIDVSISP